MSPSTATATGWSSIARRVTRVDPATGTVLEVSGLGGIQMDEHRDSPSGAWQNPNVTITYYTR